MAGTPRTRTGARRGSSSDGEAGADGGDEVDGAGDRAAGDGRGRTDGDAEVLYTIDELAAQSGVPSRTIRYYQSKGTLPSPERRGRVAFYRAEHVERLRTIAELQDRGLRLDAIAEVLQRIEGGDDSLQDWLGMGDQLQAPWSDERPVVMSEVDLVQKIGRAAPERLADLANLGLIVRQGSSRPATYVVPSPGLLDINLSLERAEIDASVVGEAGEIMRRRMATMADELVTFFADRAGAGFGGAGEPEAIERSFAALRPMAMQAAQLLFAQEMERALRRFVERGGAMPPKARPRRPASTDRPA